MKSRYGILKKSDRAIEAESRGLVTYSKLKKWQKNAVDRGVVGASEWHHTGAAANRTYYYDPANFEELNPADYKTEPVKKVEQADLNRIKIEITYDKVVGGYTTRQKKWSEFTAKGLDVRKSDNVIIGAGGRRLSSNNKEVKIFVLPQKCRKWQEVSLKTANNLGYRFQY